MRPFTSCFILCLAAAAAAGQTPKTAAAKDGPAASPEIVLIDGESFHGRPVSIGPVEAVFRTSGGARKAPMRDLWRIRFAEQAELMNQPGKKVIVLTGGGMLGVETFDLSKGGIAAESELLGKVAIEMSLAAAMYLPKRSQRPAGLEKRFKQMSLRSDNQDCLVAEDDRGKWIPVLGVLKAVKSRKVTFRFEETDRTIDLACVRVIQLARVPRRTPLPATRLGSPQAGRLVGRDGSIVPFTSIEFAASKLSITADGLTADAVNLPAVAEIRFRSDRFVYLSDLKPAKVVQAGLFDAVFPFRRDRSSAGGPLRIGEVTYPKGLGLHSRCELTYDLDGKFAVFVATVGIDEAAGNRGDAALKILGDGKDLLKPLRLVGGAKAAEVRCDVTGVKQLTILADFGKDGIGVGDHVDLAEARLIKK